MISTEDLNNAKDLPHLRFLVRQAERDCLQVRNPFLPYHVVAEELRIVAKHAEQVVFCTNRLADLLLVASSKERQLLKAKKPTP